MQDSNRSALKEWASVEHALANGQVALLLRKGGIHEQRGDFRVEHREFWIFPTAFHQSPNQLVPDFQPLLDAPHERDQLRIQHYAVVTDALRVGDLLALERLKGLHPFTQDAVRARFAYRDRPYLHVLVLQVYRLPEPHVVPNTLEYDGCVSWVELDDALSTRGAQPVLSEAELSQVRSEVLARLGEHGVARV